MKLIGILSHFLLYLFLMLLMWIGVAYVAQNICYSNASRFYNNVVRKMEEQYYDPTVLEECRQAAQDNGYRLTVDVYEQEGRKTTKVILDMTYIFPIVEEERHYIIEGYAR